MCEQCNTDALNYGEILPHWYLMRAQKDGVTWRKDEWGLICSNDPSMTWTTTPTPDPLFRIASEAEAEVWFKAHPKGTPEYERTMMADPPEDFCRAFIVEPGLGYDLVVAAKAKGYDPDTSGDFMHWMFSYIGEHLETAVPVPHSE